MVLPMELDGTPFSAEGLRSTKQRRLSQLQGWVEAEGAEPPPEEYRNNSNKEALCLEYIANFRAQFDKLYPGGRRLFLTAPNEYGVEKFVCTTLRPTLLPYRGVYDVEICAEFVSNFLHYEPLERPTEPPGSLPSPGQVLDWTVGDCFDFAMVLCSLLLGAGYDAYVVYGTAPGWITVRDRTRTECPYIAKMVHYKAGEEPHENGIGMPPRTAATKVDDGDNGSFVGSGRNAGSRESYGGRGSGAMTSDAQPKATRSGSQSEAKGGASTHARSTHEGAESLGVEGGMGDGNNKGTKGGDGTALGPEGAGMGDGKEEVAAEGLEHAGGGLLAGEDDEEASEDQGEEAPPYTVQPRGAPKSSFLAEAARKVREEKEAARIDPWQSDDDEEEANEAVEEEQRDPLRGQRVHAWVLVRAGKRGMAGMFYVEPTTGAVYPTSCAPYLTVESLFNNKNYWVNMKQHRQQQQQQQQQQRCQGRRQRSSEEVPEEHGGGDGTRIKRDSDRGGAPPLSFDLLDGSLWECVFMDPLHEALEAAGATDESDDLGLLGGGEDKSAEGKDKPGDGSGEIGDAQKDSILELPPSWVRKLTLDRDLAALRFPPKGRRTIFYRRAKAELFAENIHPEGITLRLTLFKDRLSTITKEIREFFVNRADRLYSRARYPLEGRVSELFRPGRANSLRNFVTWSGRRRELYFFVEARLDGLVSRMEDLGKKVVQTFDGRPDRLTYRSVNLMPPEEASAKNLSPSYILPDADGTGDSVVYKMTEKFERDSCLAAHQDVAKRTYYLLEGRIRTLFHYAEDGVTRASKMHFKDNRAMSNAAFVYDVGSGGGSESNKVGLGDTSNPARPRAGAVGAGAAGGGPAAAATVGNGVDGGSGKVVEETLQDAVLAEKDCFTEVRHVHMEMAELIKQRNREEEELLLERPIFETARERRAEQEKISEQMAQEEEDVDQRQVDYLTPFLQHVPDMRHVSAADAQRARDACLRALKDRLLERANIINARLNEETSALAKKQAAFQRNQRDNDGNSNAEEEFEMFCSEAMFRIQVLEQRLLQHEENALKKYADVDAKLASDPRLKVLNSTSS